MADKFLTVVYQKTDELQKEFETFVTRDTSENGKDQVKKLYSNVSLFNYFLKTLDDTVYDIQNNYPYFYEKYGDDMTLSAVELKEMIDYSLPLTPNNFITYIYTDESIVDYTNALTNKAKNARDFLVQRDYDDKLRSPVTILKEFDRYISSKQTIDYNTDKSFCSMAKNVFEQIDKFVNLWNNIESMYGEVTKIIDEIANMTMEQFLSKITDFIKAQFMMYVKQLESLLYEKIADLTGLTPSNAERVAHVLIKNRNNIDEFFSQATLDKIIKKIQASINYVVSLFEEAKIEEIEYIVYKFCQLTENINNIFDMEFNPIKTTVLSIQETQLALKSSSNVNTSRAIGAGALRFSSDSYDYKVREEILKYEQRKNKYGGNYVPPISSGDVDGITPYNDGAGDSRVGFQGGWVSVLGREGWDRVEVRVKAGLMRLQKKMGIRLIVNSGYRSPEYNARVGGATNSQHMHGMALDITWAGFSGASAAYKRNFIEMARSEGFSGFGGYSGFIHIDMGPARTWGIQY